MKNQLKNVGVLTLGLSVAFVLSPGNAAAVEDDSVVEVNLFNTEDEKSLVLDVEVLDELLVGDVNVNTSTETDGSAENDEVSAVVDVSVDASVDNQDGVMDDLSVSVLKRGESETGMNASLSSVELDSPVADDLNVDLALIDRKDNSFEGSLIEVNGEDSPLVGDTHVGVLDWQVAADAEGKSFSSGLIQADLAEGLLEDTSVGVLVMKLEANEDGESLEGSGASLNLGMAEEAGVSVDVLKGQGQFGIDIDSDVTAPDEEMEVPEGSEGADNANSEQGEEDQGSTTPPANVGDSGDGFANEEDGTTNNNAGENETVTDPEQDATVDNGLSSEVDADSGVKAGESSEIPGANAAASERQANVTNAFAMNDANPSSSLPKTGGFWDGKRLAFVAFLLMVMGFAIRRFGKSKMSAA